jgi:hypothetical protein
MFGQNSGMVGGLTTPQGIRGQDLSIFGRNFITNNLDRTGSQGCVNVQNKFEDTGALNSIGLNPEIDPNSSYTSQNTKTIKPKPLNPWTIQVQVISETPDIFGKDGESLSSGPSPRGYHIDSVKSHAISTKRMGIQSFSLKSIKPGKSPYDEAQERAVQDITGLKKSKSQFSSYLPDIPPSNNTPKSQSILESKAEWINMKEDEIQRRSPIVEEDETQKKSPSPYREFYTESIPDVDTHTNPKDTKTWTVLNMKNLNGIGFESIWGERYQRCKEMKSLNKKKSMGASTGNLWVTRSSINNKSISSVAPISQ